MFSLRYVDTELDRPRWRGTANVSILPTLLVGLEFNMAADEVGPLVTAFLLTETETRPAVFLGTSSDRIGSPKGAQAYFGTVAKYLPMIRTSPYVTLNYSEWDDGFNVPFGANVNVGGGFSVQPMYDGNRSHLMGSFATEQYSVSLMWVWLETFGAAVSFGF